MHGGAAVVVAFQETPRSAAMADYLSAADKEMTTDDSESSNSHSHSHRLEGKVAIVTGGAGGIGETIARLFVAHGASVVIADVVDYAAGQAVASSLGPPERCSYERCDVSVEADVERAVRRAVARHGRLDVLCNNAAGARGSSSSSILALDAAELERAVRVNALGAALGMKHAAAAMLEAGDGGGGSIVSVGSVAGGMGPHALVGLTKNAACELGRHGIRVNCISPLLGVATLLHASESEAEAEAALRLTLRASDIAEAALFLASDDSRYVSGHNLVVDAARNLIGL